MNTTERPQGSNQPTSPRYSTSGFLAKGRGVAGARTLPSSRMWLLLIALLFCAGIGGAYFYGKQQVGLAQDKQTEDTQVLEAVGKHIMLPAGVIPKIGKMINTDQFKSDPFLRQAQVGDYVLFYPYEGRTVKAIIWRPSDAKIVDVSLVSIPALDSGIR